MARPALFLDRDGVIMHDAHLLTDPDHIELIDGAAEAISRAQRAGHAIVVVTNQSVVARGLITEDGMRHFHARLDELLVARGARPLDSYQFCPHHPEATLIAYRQVCDCRKPHPSMLLRAAAELDLDLARSAIIGDRLTDVLAGHRAGCQTTILVLCGADDQPLISHVDPDDLVEPDHRCDDLAAAIDLVLAAR